MGEKKKLEENIVYHYCGVDTFLNIVKNHTLRLTDLCKSTDCMELKSLLQVIKERIIEKYKSSNDFYDSLIYGIDMDESFEIFTDMLIKKIENDTDQMLFGICFSEKGDLLEQWREYADRGTGVSIGFDKTWFLELCTNDIFKFSKIIYGYETEDKFITKIANSFYYEMCFAMERKNSKAIIDKDLTLSSLHQKLTYQESLFIKREEYKNENEWRLIVDDESMFKSYAEWDIYYNWKNENNDRYDKNDIKRLIPNGMEFMVRNGKIIPFLDLKFDLCKEHIPIKKVIIGPNCKVDELDVFHLLGFYKYNVDEIEIARSESSYCLK